MKRPGLPQHSQRSAQAKRARSADINEDVRALMQALLRWESRRVACPPTGYRNKITYSLSEGEPLQISDLASEGCNSMVGRVCRCIRESCAATGWRDLDTFREISVKHSRTGEFLMKMLLSTGGIDVEGFTATTFAHLTSSLREKTPEIVCFVAQHCPGRARPTKADPYISVFGSALQEVTPWGDRYVISPDTFSEVNHEAEDRLWEYFADVLERLRAEEGQQPPRAKRALLLMGRDSNASAVSLFAKGGAVFGSMVCLPHCPLVARDLGINTARFLPAKTPPPATPADSRSEGGSDAAGMAEPCPAGGCEAARIDPMPNVEVIPIGGKFAYSSTIHEVAVARGGGGASITAMLNAGRGGLAADTAAALRAHSSIDHIVYISCNQETAFQDVEILLSPTPATPCASSPLCSASADTPFVLSGYRVYEFQPGTDYTMQVFEFRRRPPHRLKTIALPVGPPGCGKSTAGLWLARGMASLSGLGSPEEAVLVVERDSVFAARRSAGDSLKQAKRATHQGILETLAASRAPYVYYDSTNGDPGGRTLMARTCLEASPHGSGVLVLLSYDVSQEGSEEWLLANCLAREGHVAFPASREEAVLKISNVLKGIVRPSQCGAECSKQGAAGHPDGARPRCVAEEVVVSVAPQACHPREVAQLLRMLTLVSAGLGASIPFGEPFGCPTITVQCAGGV